MARSPTSTVVKASAGLSENRDDADQWPSVCAVRPTDRSRPEESCTGMPVNVVRPSAPVDWVCSTRKRPGVYEAVTWTPVSVWDVGIGRDGLTGFSRPTTARLVTPAGGSTIGSTGSTWVVSSQRA